MILNGRLYYPQVLIISGAGRHVGKTTLACRIIDILSQTLDVIAFKISPHFHQVSFNQPVYEVKKRFAIYEELSTIPLKDSSKMKNAGASRVFYIQATRENMGIAFLKSMETIDATCPVICESGGLVKYIKPGLSIYLKKAGLDQGDFTIDPETKVVTNDGRLFRNIVSGISYKSGIWDLNNINT